MLGNKLLTEKNSKLAYKLLHDLLLVLIVFFVLAMTAEGLLPGIVSSRIGLYKIVLAILMVIFSINVASKKAGFIPSLALNKKAKYALPFLLAVLILNGMLGIGLPINIFILLLALASLYLSAKIFFNPEN